MESSAGSCSQSTCFPSQGRRQTTHLRLEDTFCQWGGEILPDSRGPPRGVRGIFLSQIRRGTDENNEKIPRKRRNGLPK